MDRQYLSSGLGRPFQQLDGKQISSNPAARVQSLLDSFGQGSEHHGDRFPANQENNNPGEGGSAGKAGYSKDRQPARGILRKPEGSDMQALQSKFSSLQDDVLTFSAQTSNRRNSLLGRGGIPAPLQPLSQQAVPLAPAPAARPTDVAAAPWRPALSAAPSIQPLQPKPLTLPHDVGCCQDDDVGLGAPAGKERLVKLPTGSLANTKTAKAAQETYEEPTFQQSCNEGLTKQLQRTKDGATDKSRIQELAELVKHLRKCLKDMGSRTTGYIEKSATIEREIVQQVENLALASETARRQLEAELASARSSLAAAERDYLHEKAQLGLELDTQKGEVSWLQRDRNRLTEERDQAREDAARAERARQQLELELKELRKTTSQQQREISVSQSEVVRLLTEEKIAAENRLASLQDEFNRQVPRLAGMQECIDAFEQENRALHNKINNLESSLSSKESLLAHHQDQTAKLKDDLAQARGKLVELSGHVQQLQQELDRSNRERAALGTFIEEQSAELDSRRSRATALESTLAQERTVWEATRRELESSLASLGDQRSSLAREVAEITAALGVVTAQKEAAESSAALLAVDKASLLREGTALHNQIEFAEDRAKQMEQEATALRKQVEEIQTELEASRRVVAEKDVRLEQLEGEFAALKEVLGESTSAEGETGKQIVTKLLSKIATLQHASIEAEAIRRRLHNELVDLRGNIRVYCRVKPHPTPATRLGSDGTSIVLAVDGRDYNFGYDRVFGPNATQEQVFGAVSELVQSALDGFHVCVFSYGQTGAGKTHTMQGDADEPAKRGIIPRALEKILATAAKLQQEAEWVYNMEACFVEVYNQSLRDLLSQGAELKDTNPIKHDAAGGHTIVAGAKVVTVDNMELAASLVRQAGEARKVTATAMNADSSRSHCVFMLNITGWHANTGTQLKGSLCLVDLAGSERLERSQAVGATMKEACAINTSLSALGDVFTALASKTTHVPYRNSKLTYLLQPCLGGNGKTLMFVNINPEPASASESLCSLRFAAKVNGCETSAKGGARRNVQTFGGSGGSSEGEPSGSNDPAGEARRRVAAGSAAGAAGPSGSGAAAPQGPQARRPAATSQPPPQQQRPAAKVARGRAIPAPGPQSGTRPATAPAAGSTAARAAQPGSSARFNPGIPKLPGGGLDAVSAAAAKRMSLAPQRPGAADAGAIRTKTAPVARTGNAGVKRPGPALPDNGLKRNKP